MMFCKTMLTMMFAWSTQLVKRGAMKDRFSLCFGGEEGQGALLLGDLDLPESTVHFDYVPMLPTTGHYYMVKVNALGLGGTKLPIRQVGKVRHMNGHMTCALQPWLSHGRLHIHFHKPLLQK